MKSLLEALVGKHNINNFYSNDLIEIKNFKYEDILEDGNIVEIVMNKKIHHGIVLPQDIIEKIFHKKYLNNPRILAFTKQVPIFWDPNMFIGTFPFHDKNIFINNVYKSDIDVSKINNLKEVENIFKEYNLKYLS